MKELWGSVNPIVQNLIINFIFIIIFYNIIMWISGKICSGVHKFKNIFSDNKIDKQFKQWEKEDKYHSDHYYDVKPKRYNIISVDQLGGYSDKQLWEIYDEISVEVNDYKIPNFMQTFPTDDDILLNIEELLKVRRDFINGEPYEYIPREDE